MKRKNYILNSLFISCLFFSSSQGIVFVRGNNGDNSTFTVPAVTSAFYRPTQDFFLGLINNSQTPASDYNISAVFPYTTAQAATFTALVSSTSAASALAGKYISNLTVMQQPSNIRIPLLVCTAENGGPANFVTGDNASTTFHAMNTSSTLYAQTASLMDAGVNPATAPLVTHGILGLTTSFFHVFAAVKANAAANGNFGADPGDGISITGIQIWDDITFSYHNASTGSGLQPRATPISIDAATTPNSFGIVQTAPGDNVAGPLLDMHYDPILGKLYVSAQMFTTTTNLSQIFGFIIFNYNDTGDSITPIAQCANTNLVASNNKIVAAYRTGGQNANVCMNWLGTMHTSTGFPYLITNSGVRAYAPAADSTNQPNNIYALPLVQSNNINRGRLAVGDGTEIASANTTLATGATLGTITGTTSGQAEIDALLVGAGPLPIAANDINKIVSSMEVAGDTVYAALSSDVVDATNQPGVYYSQAIFNNFGKIARWTHWAKAAPFQLGSNLTEGSTETMYIDAVSGGAWGLELGGDNVKRTDWTITGWNERSLITQLNRTFIKGCYSVFDLNQSVGNFGNAGVAVNRYAVFGGMDIVSFAHVSTAQVAATPTAPQTVVTDFLLPTNYMTTTLPTGAGPVRVLGYSKGSIVGGNTQGFFFAGTKNGLYVWATNGGGVGASDADFGALGLGVFNANTHSWQKVPGVQGEVLAIKSRGAGAGGKIYVLTSDTGDDLTIEDRVYSIAQANTAAALNPVLIATSGTAAAGSDLSDVQLFYDLEVLAEPAVPGQEQVFIATTNGIRMSTTAGGVQAATDQATALWTVMATTENSIYNHLSTAETILTPTVLWAAYWVDNVNASGFYNRSALSQFCFSDNLTAYAEVPATGFNDDGNLNLGDLRRVKDFWNDGCRRFLISIPQTSNGLQTMLSLLPYQNARYEWNLVTEAPALAAERLREHSRYYWVQSIGATGSIMAGTNRGVISLE